MFRVIAALVLASATANSAAPLLPSSSWWERVTVTISGDGKPQSCRFESSLKPNDAQTCDVVGNEAALATSSGSKDQYTRITFERRFQPGIRPESSDLQPGGETLLGGQVMALGIDPRGAVKTCKVVAETGSIRPQYGCEQATTEHFEASAEHTRTAMTRAGYMTVVVYGHSEHVV